MIFLSKIIRRIKRGYLYTFIIIQKINKYEFKLANDFEKKQAFSLRYVVYCEEIGYLPKERYPNKIEIDEYDSVSKIFVVKKKGQVIGTIRVVPNHNNLLPTEKYFNEAKRITKSMKKYAEVSRFVVNRNYRGTEVTIGLIKIVILYAYKNNFTHYLITCPAPHEKIYNKFGFKRVTKPYRYQGVNDKHLSITMVNDILDSKKKISKMNSRFYKILIYNHKNFQI